MKTRLFATPATSRREFFLRSAATAAVLAVGQPWAASAQQVGGRVRPLLVFSKAFQQLDDEATAELVAEVGWDGIECPVRRGGQVTPERVEEDLPRLVESLKKRGKAIYIATTDVREVTPLNEKVLRTLARLGISRYRMAYWRYDLSRPIPEQLAEIKAQLKDVVALSRELGLRAGLQNHSGGTYVGGPVWDLHHLFEGHDAKTLGAHFDIGHATVEGGTSWPVQAKLLEPWFHAVYVKDFQWQKGPKNWSVQWCPLGEGMISRQFFAQLKSSAFSGPISQHFEYPLGERPQMVQKFKADLATLQSWLA